MKRKLVTVPADVDKLFHINMDILTPLLERARAEMKVHGFFLCIETEEDGKFLTRLLKEIPC